MNGSCKGQYIRLDAAVVGLLAVLFHALVGAAAAKGCGSSKFSDVPSSVVLSDIVFEGRLASRAAAAVASSLDSVDSSSSDVRRADFTVDRIHKGSLSEEITGKERRPTDATGIVYTAGYRSAEEEEEEEEKRRGVAESTRPKVSVMLSEETYRCTVEMKVGHTFIVFLRAGNSDFGHGHRFYWASSPPTISTPKSIRDVKKYSCKTCVQHPEAELSSKRIFWKTGDDIRLKCLASGSPTPRITWFRNKEIVEASERLEIISQRSSSLLIVRGAEDSDGGVYSCSAENVVGVATSLDRPVSVESESMMMQNDDVHPDAKMCDDQTYCENGGTCYFMEDVGRYCRCREGFSGDLCQSKGPDIGIGGLEDILVILCIFLMLLLLITTFAILYCIARFRKDFNDYEKRHLAMVEGERRNERIQRTIEHGERTVLESHVKLLPEKTVKSTAEAAEAAAAAAQRLSFVEDRGQGTISAFHVRTKPAPPPLRPTVEQRSPRDDSDEHFDNVISGTPEHPVRVGHRGKAPNESGFKVGSSPASEGVGEAEVKSSVQRTMTAKSPPLPGLRPVGVLKGPEFSSFASGEASSKGKSPPACESAVGGYADGRNDKTSLNASSSVDKDATGSREIRSSSGQEMFYDEVNALLLELGVSEDLEAKKHCKDQQTGLPF